LKLLPPDTGVATCGHGWARAHPHGWARAHPTSAGGGRYEICTNSKSFLEE